MTSWETNESTLLSFALMVSELVTTHYSHGSAASLRYLLYSIAIASASARSTFDHVTASARLQSQYVPPPLAHLASTVFLVVFPSRPSSLSPLLKP